MYFVLTETKYANKKGRFDHIQVIKIKITIAIPTLMVNNINGWKPRERIRAKRTQVSYK